MESIPRSIDSAAVFYGDCENPAYNIISYTWGRWQPRDQENGEAIRVRGPNGSDLGWQVPKVKPYEAFSASDFKAVLTTVAGNEGLNFVWVDVACIDQRPNAPEKDAEIGRQAAIFNRARKGYIWLHQTSRTDIENSLELIASEMKASGPGPL